MRPGVLLVRPDQHADPLELELRDHGYPVYRHAVVAIEPVTIAKDELTALVAEHWDGVIVISPNAAREFHAQLQDAQLNWPQARDYFTVGPGTAEALSPLAQQPISWPAGEHNSEALLEFAELEQLEGQKWLLITGENGRDLLPEALRSRGAEVKICACYRRLPTTDEVKSAEQEWHQNVTVIMVSSAEQAKLFFQALSSSGQEWARNCHWIVPTGRIAEQIAEFKVAAAQIHEARSALPSALIKTLLTLPSIEPKVKTAMNTEKETTPATTESPRKSQSSNIFTRVFLVLIVVSLAVLAAGGWWVWQQQRSFNAATQADIDAVNQRLTSAEVATSSTPAQDPAMIEAEVERIRELVNDRLDSERAARERSLERLAARHEDALATVQEGQSQMARQLTRMHEQLRASELRHGAQGPVLEAYELVNLAIQRLNFDYQRNTAIALLAQAESVLTESNPETYQLVIRQLRNDQELLNELPEVNTQAIVMQLLRLQTAVRELPLVTSLQPEAEKQSDDRSELSNWRQNIASAWDSFSSDLIKVRRHDGLPMHLDSDQRALLFGRIELQLQIAQQAALNHHQEYYQATLTEVLHYIDQYFATEQSSVVQFRAEIVALLELSIEPDYPNRLLSHAMLRDLVNEMREQRSANGGQ